MLPNDDTYECVALSDCLSRTYLIMISPVQNRLAGNITTNNNNNNNNNDDADDDVLSRSRMTSGSKITSRCKKDDHKLFNDVKSFTNIYIYIYI